MVLAVRFVIEILEPEQPLRKCHLAPFGVTQHDARSSSTGAGTGARWEQGAAHAFALALE